MFLVGQTITFMAANSLLFKRWQHEVQDVQDIEWEWDLDGTEAALSDSNIFVLVEVNPVT